MIYLGHLQLKQQEKERNRRLSANRAIKRAQLLESIVLTSDRRILCPNISRVLMTLIATNQKRLSALNSAYIFHGMEKLRTVDYDNFEFDHQINLSTHNEKVEFLRQSYRLRRLIRFETKYNNHLNSILEHEIIFIDKAMRYVNVEALTSKGRLLLNENDYDGAKRHLLKAIQEMSKNSEHYDEFLGFKEDIASMLDEINFARNYVPEEDDNIIDIDPSLPSNVKAVFLSDGLEHFDEKHVANAM